MLKKTDTCITSVKSTVMKLAGIEQSEGNAPANDYVISQTGTSADRFVIYNPDAVASWLYEKYTDLFADLDARCNQYTETCVSLRSVMPSVTPVCFGSMYSGVMPEIHGIMKYEKPVLKVETLFDVFIKAGKKCVIVSTSGDSISKIFLERDMDYYIYPSIHKVNKKACKLIKQNKYDLIVIYNGNYDSKMHANGPESAKAIKALRENIAAYKKIISLIYKYMPDNDVFYGFCPDHGCHEIDGSRGSHGLDMEEDMNVIHYYGFKAKQ